MNFTLLALALAFLLFLGMLVLYEFGRRLGRRAPGETPKGAGMAEGAVFALLGLVVAFAFSGAGTRFESRRALITEEANDIGTAYLRVDLLAPALQDDIRREFRLYAALRAAPPDLSDAAASAMWDARTANLQQSLWAGSLLASQHPDSAPQATMLLLPALNAMIDITTTRQMATRNHPPLAIFLMLGGLSLVGSLLVGHAAAGDKVHSRLQPLAFAAIISLAFYLIVDLEFPRAGLIQVGDADRVLRELSQGMR